MSEETTVSTEIGRNKLERIVKRNSLPRSEAEVWRPITRDWRCLYGGFYDLGVSIEWHDFELNTEFDWSRSFHPQSVELCLNLAGHGTIAGTDQSVNFEPLTAGFYSPGNNSLRGRRHSAERHQFVTIEFAPGFLREQLAACDGALHPLVEEVVKGTPSAAGVSESRRLSTEHQQLIARLVHPPVFQRAQPLWYHGKVLELMAEFFFQRQAGDELFCDRQKRRARERVDRVVAILRRSLDEPPSLEEIGREAGCSPFHLSRIFSKEMGVTIPQYLRQIRMERAAELLRSGKYNVTEAALEVGYSSLSHFSQAFCQTIGCCPNLYPHATALLKKSTPT